MCPPTLPRDPVQLNLLYEQAKEQILEGTHPVEIDKAITFAAYQVASYPYPALYGIRSILTRQLHTPV